MCSPATRWTCWSPWPEAPIRNDPVSRTVLEDINVLTVGEKIQRDDKGRGRTNKVKVVTLQLKPVQAERLALSSTEGRVVLALRNQSDREPNRGNGVTLSGLVPLGRPQDHGRWRRPGTTPRHGGGSSQGGQAKPSDSIKEVRPVSAQVRLSFMFLALLLAGACALSAGRPRRPSRGGRCSSWAIPACSSCRFRRAGERGPGPGGRRGHGHPPPALPQRPGRGHHQRKPLGSERPPVWRCSRWWLSATSPASRSSSIRSCPTSRWRCAAWPGRWCFRARCLPWRPRSGPRP